jgi:ABC-type nickel/cobalt efflux system permease component RcnA
MDLWTLLSQYMDGYAVIIAFGLTQFIRTMLPAPAGSAKVLGVSFYVTGWSYRILPYIPLLIAILVVMIKDAWISPTMKWDDAFVKGLVSGIAASYVYRTIKITIFGKQTEDRHDDDHEDRHEDRHDYERHERYEVSEPKEQPKDQTTIGGVIKTILG